MPRISRDRLDMEEGRIDRAIFKDYGETLIGGADGHQSGVGYLVDLAGPKTGNALILNGDGYFRANAAQTAVTNWSISAWIKPALNQAGIAVYNGNDAGGYGFGVILNGGNSGSTLTGLFGNVNWLTTGYTFSDSNWHHVVMTRDATTTRFYVDGSLLATTFADTPNTAANHFTIGCELDSSSLAYRFFKGGIDEVRFYSSALSLGDVQTLYALGSVTSGLLGYWNLDDGTGRTALDSSGSANHATAYGNPVWSLNGSNAFHVVLTANCTISFSAASPVGSAQTFTLYLKQDPVGGRTVTWPSSVRWVQGYTPTLTSQKNRYDVFQFTTTDAGTTWLGFVGAQNFQEKTTLWSWGLGSYGRLGGGDALSRSSPVQVGILTNWASVDGGDNHNLGVKSDGTLWTWGRSLFGQLGHNSLIDRSSPTQVGSLTTWSFVSSGWYHPMALASNGTLWSWGYGTSGQLGHNDALNRSSPTQVGALTTWAQVAEGRNNTFAIKTDGTLWSWGLNDSGQLGHNSVISRSSPTQVGALTTWSRVMGGRDHTVALKTDGTLWTWGLNTHGTLGHGDVISRSSPAQVGTLTNWAKIAGGRYHTVAIKTDGTLWTWGRGSGGRIGHGNVISRSSPTQLGSSTWTEIEAKDSHTFAIKTDGTLWSWGVGGSGRLGHGEEIDRSSPTQVGSLATWTKVITGRAHTLALRFP